MTSKKSEPPKLPRPHNTIRTTTPGYFFGSLRANDTLNAQRGTGRKTTKLPTSLAELKKIEDEKR